MERFGITRAHVSYIMQHYDPHYGTADPLVYRGALPDGRVVKVKVDSDGHVRDVHTYLTHKD